MGSSQEDYPASFKVKVALAALKGDKRVGPTGQ